MAIAIPSVMMMLINMTEALQLGALKGYILGLSIITELVVSNMPIAMNLGKLLQSCKKSPNCSAVIII